MMPASFWQGVEQFNQRQFYTCHDTLEALWIEAIEPERTFYQGILQVSVALYHLGNQNWKGAVILLGEGIHRLRSYPSDFADLQVDRFLEECQCLLEQLQQAGPEKVADFAQELVNQKLEQLDQPVLCKIPEICLI